MAGQNQYQPAAPLDGTEAIAVWQHGATRTATTAQLVALATSLAGGGTDNVLNVRSYGAKGDGVTDDTAAFAAAIAGALTFTYGTRIRVPSGRYMLSGTLTAALTDNQAITFDGDGATLSELLWTSDTDGIAVTLAYSAWLRGPVNRGNHFGITGISLVRGVNSEGRTALTVVGTAAANPGCRQIDLSDLILRGTPDLAAWQNGIALTTITGAYIDRLYFHTSQNGPVPGTGTGIAMTGSATYPMVEVHIANSILAGPATGITLNDHIEGVTVTDTDCVGVNIGISGTAPALTSDMLSLIGVHIDAIAAGIQLTGFNRVQAIGTYFIGNRPNSSDSLVAIDLTNSARHTISGCNFFGRPSSVGQTFCRITNTTGFDTQAATITGNAAEALSGEMVTLAGSTYRAIVTGNLAMGTAATFGSDARNSSVWTGNSLNSKTATSTDHTFNGLVTVNDPGGASTNSMTIGAIGNASGMNLRLLGNGSTTPNKTVRVVNGQFQVQNSAYTTTILNLSDAGALSITSWLSQPVANNISAAGASQVTAAPLTTQFNQIGSATAGQGVMLPDGGTMPQGAATSIEIWNASAAAVLVYPASGGTISGLGLNNSYSLAAGSRASFWYRGAGLVWSPA